MKRLLFPFAAFSLAFGAACLQADARQLLKKARNAPALPVQVVIVGSMGVNGVCISKYHTRNKCYDYQGQNVFYVRTGIAIPSNPFKPLSWDAY